MLYVGILIFIAVFYCIITEKIPSAWATMAGGLLMTMIGIINQEEVLEKFNKNSLVVKNGFVSMGTYLKEEHYQIIRDGYYIVDSIKPLTFNRTVSLKANKVSNEFK